MPCFLNPSRGTIIVHIHLSLYKSGPSTFVLRCILDAYLTPLRSLSVKKLISELGVTGGDDRKIGYYAGLIVGSIFFTEMVP